MQGGIYGSTRKLINNRKLILLLNALRFSEAQMFFNGWTDADFSREQCTREAD